MMKTTTTFADGWVVFFLFLKMWDAKRLADVVTKVSKNTDSNPDKKNATCELHANGY